MTVWTRSHTAYSYWKTGKQSQQYKLSEIKEASVKRCATLLKSCIYSLVIKSHFISLVLGPNLLQQVLTSPAAMNEQYLT